MLTSKLKNQIADLILSGAFKPGEVLDEQSLAARFEVSRTPVREALQHLHAARLVEMRPRRSARVRWLNLEELRSSFEAMGELEALCARFSAERMTQSERMHLGSLVERSQDASARGDRFAYREIDAEFHATLHAGAHNEDLAIIADEMRARIALYSSAPFTLPTFEARLHQAHSEHSDIADAVIGRNAEAAHKLMIEHIGQSFLTVRQILADGTDLFGITDRTRRGRPPKSLSLRSVGKTQNARKGKPNGKNLEAVDN